MGSKIPSQWRTQTQIFSGRKVKRAQKIIIPGINYKSKIYHHTYVNIFIKSVQSEENVMEYRCIYFH